MLPHWAHGKTEAQTAAGCSGRHAAHKQAQDLCRARWPPVIKLGAQGAYRRRQAAGERMNPEAAPALPEPHGDEGWGQLGEAMRALTERQRAFVRALLTERPGHGALTPAARRAEYGRNSKPATLSKHAHDLSRSPKIIAAINEEAKKVIRGVGHAEAVAAVMNMIRDPSHRDHARAVDMVLLRADAVISKQSIDVTHRTIDPDQEALEELRAARKLGATREKLIELYGANGLDRLEALEALDNARRADAAKVIEHQQFEARHDR
jgi:phage terminase small subunit